MSKRGMKTLGLSGLLLALCAPLFAQPFPAGAAASAVWDAKGRSVGQIIGVTVTPLRQLGWVRIRTSETKSVLVPITRERGKGLDWARYSTTLYFEAPGCQGQAYAIAPQSSLGEAVAVVDSENRLLIVAEEPAQRTIWSQSARTETACTPQMTTTAFSAASPALDLDDHFSPPFTISDLRSRSVRP